MALNDHYGVQTVKQRLDDTLRSYIEAQYHIREESLIAERQALLLESGTIAQTPFLESTRVYEPGNNYSTLKIPAVAKTLFRELAKLEPNVGIFDPPYSHQAAALEEFFSGKDLIVATGTGSGKTESFLMPIIASLAMEAADRPKSAGLDGCRALLLYPLNALVSDQLARIRRLLGDDRVATSLENGRGRRVRFGMYTSRTPYPGKRSGSRDSRYIAPMFDDYYLRYIDDNATRELLKKKGKWPCKDLRGFYAEYEIEEKEYRSGKKLGKKYRRQNWPKRLQTQPGDTELLTRHEIQQHCPDVLITNYSMLEYMLLRPIERNIFSQTKRWLHSNKENHFILVLDEAHTYRGAAGAEVALLVRRLQARLEIPRERFRCILTSASLGNTQDARLATVQFARDLTGLSPASSHQIILIAGTDEKRSGARPATAQEANALAAFQLSAFQNYATDRGAATAALAQIGQALGWPSLDGHDVSLQQYVFDRLSGWGPVELLIKEISGHATRFEDLAQTLVPECDDDDIRRSATEALLALGTFARRTKDDRVLVPTRLHLFYRGLPGLFACTNRACSSRLVADPSRLGKLHTEPLVQCECGARVFEVLTHRDCGAAFIRGYVRAANANFLWHERSGNVGSEQAAPLVEVQLLVDWPVHTKASSEVSECWLDSASGRLIEENAGNDPRFLRVFLPSAMPRMIGTRQVRSFDRCPVCTRRWRTNSTKIMDLVTKGEAPFANLVKMQVVTQPAQFKEGPDYPNGGRKSLLFSDGRQKAARLARDIPREVELDSFRQAAILAVQGLMKLGREPRLNRNFYLSFVAVAAQYHLHFFDRADQDQLQRHVKSFVERYDGDLASAIDDDWNPEPTPGRYNEALLRQFCSPFYSLPSATLAYLSPADSSLKQLQKKTKDIPGLSAGLRDFSCAWISSMLDDFAFSQTISDSVRQVVAGYGRSVWGSNGKFEEALTQILQGKLQLTNSQMDMLNIALKEELCQKKSDVWFIDPDRVRLTIATSDPWIQCSECTFLNPVAPFDQCPNCASSRITRLDPQTNSYIRSRKGFWRDPVVASLEGRSKPVHITAEEHTAQLSHRDTGVVHATTEKYELRFQDVIVGDATEPIDVLSCTTTMEVGVDIGSLVAIGLRNVPPQRENYQQRAGRAGRRGSALSTVITYCQGGPHDAYYFHNPAEIVSGQPRRPLIKIDNPKIAKRHIHAYLLQTFFHEALDKQSSLLDVAGSIESAFGRTAAFYATTGGPLTFSAFAQWVENHVLAKNGDLTPQIASWLPPAVAKDPEPWIRIVGVDLLKGLSDLADTIRPSREDFETDADEDQDGGSTRDDALIEDESAGLLLNFLFDRGILPTYAFPRSLCSFLVESLETQNGYKRVVVQERPQQALALALSEYAPGRLLVIDKKTYRSGGVAASVPPTEPDRAAPLFNRIKKYVFCPNCTYVQDPDTADAEEALCPLCNSAQLQHADLITPETFHPAEARPLDEADRDQDITYATSAQFPVPIGEHDVGQWQELGVQSKHTYASDRLLIIVNKGKKDENTGFDVCNKCGAATLAGEMLQAAHKRPYPVENSMQGRVPPCDGVFQNVFLGHTFRSDLMIWRIDIQRPLSTNMAFSVAISSLTDALRTLTEALLLGASRHLDVDPGEFNGGFRIIPGEDPSHVRADIYLFDTLSGGAGYADQVGKDLGVILKTSVQTLLKNCPANCDRSCYDCLRHYGNQYWHHSLDRHLAAELLAYALDGTVSISDLPVQTKLLQPLKAMLGLDGYECASSADIAGVVTPLLIRQKDTNLCIGTFGALLDDQAEGFDHPLYALDGRPKTLVLALNEYFLSRNLPAAAEQVFRMLK
jgi:hypothetical protein